MRVFIVGGNGFIGSNVVQKFLKKGSEILVLIPENEKCDRLNLLNQKIEIIDGTLDITDENKTSIVNWKPDLCINMAWFTGKDYLYSNINNALRESSFTFFQDLVNLGVKKFIFTGTCAEYAESAEILDENSPLEPKTPYATAKLALLNDILHSKEIKKVDFTWARLFFPFGPYEPKNRLTPSAINTLLENKEFSSTPGEQIRDFLYVEDLSNAFWEISQKSVPGVVNISTGIPVSIKQYLSLLAKIMGKQDLLKIGEISYRGWDPAFIVGNNKKLLKYTNWVQTFCLSDGLEKAIEWWKAKIDNP